jgi:fumarate reductase flavoprotein subunit
MKKYLIHVSAVCVLASFFCFTGCPSHRAASGTYSATEKGFGGDVTVNLTIGSNGNIAGVTIDAAHETPGIGQAAAPKLAQAMVAAQTVAVDSISGASVTSAAVRTAAAAALKKAGNSASLSRKKVAAKAADEDITAAVVVAGAGGSGTAAALAAAEAGEKVLILEKLPAYGGNSRLASGFFAVDSKLQRERGMHLSEDVAVTRLLEFNQYLSNGPLTRAIVHNAADTVAWLSGYGMTFHLQDKTTQFAHEEDPYEAYSYHKYDNSTVGFDNLYGNLKKMGTELRTNTTMTGLIQDADGTITGVTARKEDGSVLTVHAKAVVVATGGYGGNTARIKSEMHTPYLNTIGMPSMGEGLDAMVKSGAENWDGTPLLHGCQLAKSEVAQESNDSHLAGYSDSALTWLLQSPLLWVDGSGSRFVNEDVVYDTAFWANAAYAAGGRYFIIVDQATLDSYTKGKTLRLSYCGPGPSKEGGDLTALAAQAVAGKTAWKASSLAELADAAGFDSQTFAESVSRYMTMIAQGKDTDFNKAPASLKFGVSSGPFYAFDCRAVYLGTIGGVKVDQHLRVLNVKTYKPIPGLFAAGTCAAGYYTGKGYPPFEGLACGFAWTSGRIAGQSAVQYVQAQH